MAIINSYLYGLKKPSPPPTSKSNKYSTPPAPPQISLHSTSVVDSIVNHNIEVGKGSFNYT